MSNDQYVLTLCPAAGGDLDLTSLRCRAIADAHVRFRRAVGDEVALVHAGGGDDDPSGGLAIGGGAARRVDPAVERWAQWLLERLDGAGLIYHREGKGWRLRSGKLHEESERRLEELSGWSDAALAGQRKLLEHVDDPGDSGSELEQSLSKLAAAGWSVDSKRDKGPPTVHFAAGDMPLAEGDDWRAAGGVHPRLAAALSALVGALSSDEREAAPSDAVSGLGRRLPATTVAAPGSDSDVALLDLRTVAKALRDVGGLDLPGGEPLGPVLAAGAFQLLPVRRLPEQGAPASNPEPTGPSLNGTAPAAATAALNSAEGDASVTPTGGQPPADSNDVATLIAVHGADAVRFALLHAAAPAKRFRGGEDVVGYAARFLTELRELAASRWGDAPPAARIETDDGLRRRLAGWCDTALARTTENHARLDMHRATRNAVELLARIKDFEARVTEQRGEVAGADREAVAVALALLVQLLAPLAPATADELWRQSRRDGSAGDAPWPVLQRATAAA
ncbi:MAG TPA: class I tRNA ligase family protein [Thermoleophilaceae bacterium]|nr:class I tRNA ligase family protein [Thermoleophilaceae bacterium]